MLEQIEAIKQIFYFLGLALVQQGFCKSTLGAWDTHTPQWQLYPPPAAQIPWRRGELCQAASPCFTPDKSQLPANTRTVSPALQNYICSTCLRFYFFYFFPLGRYRLS